MMCVCAAHLIATRGIALLQSSKLVPIIPARCVVGLGLGVACAAVLCVTVTISTSIGHSATLN